MRRALIEANAKLAARVAELERRLGRNSGNSSLPPSTDTFGRPARPLPSPAARRRPRGRQPGAEGSGLAMVADPDRIADHQPAVCSGCGAALEPAASCGYARRQVFDIPLATVAATEHRLHRVWCACGTVTTAKPPERVPGSPASYGPHLRALACYLLVFQHVPRSTRGASWRHSTISTALFGWPG